MPHADEYLAANRLHVEELASRDKPLPLIPAQHVAVIACMDSRLDVFDVLGLQRGDAHVIRNAGGVITEDVIRSLALSQRLMQTTEIVLVHHTECGLSSRSDSEIRTALRGVNGEDFQGPTFAFDDAGDSVRASAKELRDSPFIPHDTEIRGFVYDVKTGQLIEIGLTGS